MQSVNAALQAELDKGQTDPIVLIDLFEFYDADYTPTATGYDPADALYTFAAQEITWDGIAYVRSVISRGDIVKSITEKINSVSITFSNIDRQITAIAQAVDIEGMLCVIRCVSPSVTTDSLVLFSGRCGKPSDIDKKQFSITVTQDFGNINITIPPNKFEPDDPEGRLPSDPLFEGIPITAIGGSFTFPQVVPSTSFFGRLFGRRKTVQVTAQWSSIDATPYGQVIREILGRCQVELIIFSWADKGSHVGYLAAVSRGEVDAITNIKSRTEGLSDPVCNFANPPAPAVTHLGLAGTANGAATCQADLARGLYFSKLAYIEGAAIGYQNGALVPLGLDVADTPPVLTAIVRGKKIPVRNSSGVYDGTEAWSNNPVDILRYILTDSKFVNVDADFIDDDVAHLTGEHCDYPVVDDSGSQIIVIPSVEVPAAGDLFSRYRSAGLYSPRYFLYNELGDTSVVPELDDGPYVPIDPGDPIPDPSDPSDPTYLAQKPLIKRYTFNSTISEEVRATDFINKVLLPSFKGFLRVNKFGKIEIRSEVPSDSTRLRTATAVGATSIPVLDVTPWKTGPELLKGWVHLGFGLTTSENRKPSAAVFSTSGNSISLAGSGSGLTLTASGANLSGGSTTVQASGTLTVSGTPNAGDSITGTIDGIAVPYTLNADDTINTAAAMLAYYINANQRLNKYIRATWGGAAVITITCLHGALTVPALLKAHTTAIANPTSAPTAAGSSGGSLPAGTYLLAYADTNAIGSTYLTANASVVVTANQKIDVSSLPALVGTGRDFYMSEKAGSENLRLVASRTNNSNFSILDVPEPGAASPPTYNSTAEELIRIAMPFATNSQDVFSAWYPSLLVTLNDVYLPTVLNGHKYQVTTGGTTGTTEPTWPTTAGGTVASGTAVFTEIGSTVLEQTGLRRANVIKDSFKWPLGSRQSTVNQIKTSFRDAKNDFALQPLIVNDGDHQTYVKKKYPMEVDLSGVDNFNQAKRIANFYLSKFREGDHFHALGTGPAGLVLEEGDVICASDDSGGLINVVTRIEELRITKDHDVYVNQSRKYSTRMFSDDVGAHRIPIPSTLRFTVTKDSVFELIDNFAIRDSDALVPGWYLVVTHDLSVEGDWRGWRLLADFGDGEKEIARGDVPAVMGTADDTLASVSDPSVFDRVNSFTFTLIYDDNSLASVTEAELLANSRRNLFLVGNEYVQAATITALGNRQYTASVLLRGMFGTDSWQLDHDADERVIYMNGAERLIPIDPVRLNTSYDYKAVTTNQDDADGDIEAATWTGGTIKPFSPVNVIGARNDLGDILIEWTRRARYALGLRPMSDVPTGEETEQYEIDVQDGSDVVRTLRVFLGQAHPVMLVGDPTTGVDGNNVLTAPASNSHYARSVETFQAAPWWAEATLNVSTSGQAHFAVIPSNLTNPPSNIAGNLKDYNVIFNDNGSGQTSITVTHNGVFAYNSGSLSGAPATVRIRMEFTGAGDVKFYRVDSGGSATVPFFTSAVAPRFPYRLHFVVNDAASVNDVIVVDMVKARARYTTEQQTIDFGSNQSSLSLKLFQISAIIGRGDVREAVV